MIDIFLIVIDLSPNIAFISREECERCEVDDEEDGSEKS